MILESVENGPLIWTSIEENGVRRPKKYSELSATEAIQADCDVKASNIILQGLPPEVYALGSNHKVAKELWERIQLLMQGTSLTKQEKECKLYDEFDEFSYKNGETLLNCTKINLDNKSVSETLTAELERYKDQSQNSVNFEEPNPSTRPTQVEVPKELPNVNMVHTSLKKLKHHLASFDVVVKERTTATAITKGTWGFEHTKACFRDEIILFVKALKDLFNSFDQFLIDELFEVQSVFHQMEQAIEQHRVESKRFQVKMNKVLNENERLLEEVISKDIVNMVSQEKDMVIKKLKERIKSLSGNMKKDKIKQELEEIQTINIELDHRVTKLITENEHLKWTYKQLYDSIKSSCIRSKEQCDDLIKQVNIKSAENSDLNASLQEKVLVITALKDKLRKLKGKVVVAEAVILHPIDPKFLKIDVSPLAPKLQNNRTAHYDYLKHTQEETATLREIVEQERSLNPLNTSLDYVYFEVAFRQHSCFIRNIEGVDLLTGSQGNNLYTLSLGDMMVSSPICLLSKASKTKSWLWHRRLSHLNFGTINHLSRQCLIRGLPKLKFEKDHLYSACAMGKIRRIRTDNRTDFVNQTLREYYEQAGISHETSVSHSPQQNSVVKRRNHMLIEAAHAIRIIETIHVDFDELTPMASEQSSLGPALDPPAPKVIAPIAEVVAPEPAESTGSPSSTTVDQDAPSPISPEPAESTGSPSSTTVDQDAPSPSKSQTTLKTQPLVIPNDVEEDNHDIEVAHMGNDLFFGMPIPEVYSDQSSSTDSIHTIVHPDEQISQHNIKWTKDHPLENIIGQLARPVSIRLQLHKQALFYYYNAFLTSVEPRHIKML
nr:integrase, catalytic region, zinc finger, CCHC-type, peptidase aspartic, catalytic [Tanacetum cinerariifolium]